MKWEYITKTFELSGIFSAIANFEEIDQELNVLGSEGWELVEIHFNSGNLKSNLAAVAVLKRQK
ncbi:DUF4177 domain-containing protein (plasmid) [Pseudoalteromonas sp. T1lg65]|uniref:DUF4177 domain-containing protein n=1 Tax=Pseudoalteromonas sp. T1lg65 TaxID=2077101 RepID=UPI003F7A814B